MRRIRITVAGALLLIVLVLIITLSKSPIETVRANTPERHIMGETRLVTRACQSGETLPRGTTGIRFLLFAATGPRVTAEVRVHGRVIAHGEHGSGWRGDAVTVPLRALPTTQSGVTLCFALLLNGNENLLFVGMPTEGPLAARGPEGTLPGRIAVEYVKRSRASWWSQGLEVARRMGLGHAASGTWSVGLVVMLVAALTSLCVWLLPRELR